ncbi:Retrovirus-related Pol polyprotein from transposon [Ceratobasidium sp. AG-Ba]|nr:Retrovirus-related Pol polyprotein from transposon [Ceratobasidium sp. AG-Ba]
MSRPPGTAWMGTTSTLVQGQLGDHCEPFNITFDSGSDITLISKEKYKSLNNPPPKQKGRSIQVVQVTDKCIINEFVTLPVVFNTPEGQVEMLVEAYVVKNMTTPFILRNNFGNQYLLSLVRNKEGSFIELGISGRRIPIIRSESDPRTDDAGHAYSVTNHKVLTLYIRDKPKKHKPKSYSTTPIGTAPVWIYDTKTLPPKSLSLIRVKTTFGPGEELGFVEKAMHSNRSHEDLYGLSDCIINANNPKLQIANFGNTLVRIQAGQIIGYMHPISALSREGELSVEQKKQGEALVNLVNTLEQLDPIKEEPIDPEYSKSPEGGPKIWDNPGPDIVPSEDAFKEIEFGPNLSEHEKRILQNIIKKNLKAFSFDGRLGTYPAKIRIRLKDENTRPVSLAPYPVSPEKKEVIGKQIDDWLRLGVIQPSKSPWGAPVIVVYRNGKPRVCIDYRRLNDLTIANVYPLPLQKDILDSLSGSIYFTTLDALAGFNQLTIHEEDRHKTAFTCWKGHYEAVKLLFGKKNGPAEFQEVMDQVLVQYKYLCALVYIDDIVVYSKTFEDHCSHLDQVLGSIADSGITLSPKKCKIGFDFLILLGQRVSRLGLSTQKEKVDAILGMAPPKNVPQLRTIIGAIVYFGHMIARMAETWVPWQWGDLEQKSWDLVKRALTSAPVLVYPDTDKPFRLYTDASDVGLAGVLQQIQLIKVKDLTGTRAFECLEKAYKAKQPIPKLCTPVPNNEHVVAGGDKEWNTTNWLDTQVPIERVCAFWSRILRKEERNYSATECEGLALKEALVKWQGLLEGAKFVAFTDHSALIFIGRNESVNTRMTKYNLFYASYPGMTIMHRAGRVHDNADPLSRYLFRIPYSDNPLPLEHKSLKLGDGKENLSLDEIKLDKSNDAIKNTFKEIHPQQAQEIDHLVSQYVTSHLDDYAPSLEVLQVQVKSDNEYSSEYTTAYKLELIASISPQETNRFLDAYIKDDHFSKVISVLSDKPSQHNSSYPQYSIGDNRLIYFTGAEGSPRLCVPKALIPEVLKEVHELASEGAHTGYARTYNRVCATYYWPGMAKQVEQFVNTCDVCQKTKPKRHGKIGYLQPIPIPEQPFEVITLDFIMDLPESQGYNAILVIVDKLTRYAHFIPCTTKINEVETAALFCEHIWSQYGLPRQIISDRDARWTGAFWDHLTTILGIKRALTTAHHPQADGQTEVMNQTLEIMLRSYVDDTKANWKELLPALAFSYNTSIHSATKQTPAFLLQGFEPLRPSHLLAQTSERIPRIESELAESFSEEMQAARNKAKNAIQIAQTYQEKSYNKGQNFVQFHEGNQVLINLKTLELQKGRGRKLNQVYDGPFKVMEQISPVTYRLQLPEEYSMHPVINIAHLEKYSRSEEYGKRAYKPLQRGLEEDNDVYEVEKIVDEGWQKKGRRKIHIYRI